MTENMIETKLLPGQFLGDLQGGSQRMLLMVAPESRDGQVLRGLRIMSGLGAVLPSQEFFVLSIGTLEGEQFQEQAQISLRDGLGSGWARFDVVPPVRALPGVVVTLRVSERGQPAPLPEVSVIAECGTLANRRV